MTPDELQLLAGLVQAGRVTREQAAWLQAEAARRGAPLAALLAEKGVAGPAPLSATVAAPPPRAAPTPPAGVPLGATVATPSQGGGSATGPLRAVDAEQLPPEVRAALADPRRRIGRWAALAELGRGANGVVHKAFDPLMGRAVAIKQMLGEVQPEDLERFRREVVAGGQLRHPGIVGVHEVGVHLGAPFLVMELVEGQSLERLLVEGRLSNPAALEALRQVALALAHAHGLGIIHRDVKPANILVDAQGSPRLGDFGLARLGNQQGLTKTGQVLGTPTTMAPEQAAGEQDKHGPATDVWALGAILYRIVTGRPPFQASSFQAQLAQILFEKPKAPSALTPTVDPRLEALILRCLEKEPRARPGAADVAAELARIQAGPPPARSPKGLVLAAGALVLVLGSSLLGVLAARRLLASGVAPVTTAPPGPTPTEAPPSAEPVRPRPAWPRSSRSLLRVADVRGDPRWCNGTPIGRLAATRDGREVVAVGVGTFRRFDATTGESVDLECRAPLASDEPDHPYGRWEDWADGAAITEDGELAARGDRAGRILLHRRGEATCRPLARLSGPIGSLLFDGGQLLAGTGTDLWRIDLRTGRATSLALVNSVMTGLVRLGDTLHGACLDGSLVSAGGRDGPRILPVVANVRGSDFERSGGVELTGLATDGERLFLSLQRFGEPFVYGSAQQLERQAPTLQGDALNVEVVAPGRLLLVGYPGGNQLVELSSGKTTPLPGHVEQAHGAARLAAGALSGGYDGLLFAWTLDGETRGGPAPRLGHATSLSVSPSGASVVTTGSRKATTRWLPRTGEERQLQSAARSLAVDDGRVALWTDRLVLVDPAGALAPVQGEPPPPAECVALLPGRQGGVLTCDAAGVIRSWSLLGAQEGALTTHFAAACAAVSPDRSTMVLGGADGQLLLVPLERPKEGRLIATHVGVLAVAFDGPGRVLTAGLDRRLRAWRTDGERDQPPAFEGLGHERAVEDLTPLGDGRVVTCARDGTVRLWSATGAELDRLDLGPADVPARLAVAPSGLRVYVGTWRGQLLTVDVVP